MNRNPLDHRLSRRGFMRQAACASLGAVTMINALSTLRLTAAATSLNCGEMDDSYKTMVCIYLGGGNDSNNLLVPIAPNVINSPAGTYTAVAYNNYNSKRGNELGFATEEGDNNTLVTSLNELNLPPSDPDGATDIAFNRYYGGSRSRLGTHPNAIELSQLFDNEKLAFVCNVGTLAFPFADLDEYEFQTDRRPHDLFSHNSQTLQWMTSVADAPSATGWGGRVADILNACNGSSEVPMTISLTGGANSFMRSALAATTPLGIGPDGALGLKYSPSHPIGAIGDENPDIIDHLLELSDENLMINEYTKKARSGKNAPTNINNAIETVKIVSDNNDTSEWEKIEGAFDGPVGGFSLAKQLKMVATLIAANGNSDSLNNKRQIFFVSVGGYDTHDNHMLAHEDLMTELSVSLNAFNVALEATGDWENTVAFTASDFNRTLTPNDDGLDHAWAGHQIVMGGPIQGGEIYGHFPALDGEMDADGNGRGRFIPTVSVDQYSAKIAEWFGVPADCMDEIFPNLNRFNNDDTTHVSHPNIDFIKEE